VREQINVRRQQIDSPCLGVVGVVSADLDLPSGPFDEDHPETPELSGAHCPISAAVPTSTFALWMTIRPSSGSTVSWTLKPSSFFAAKPRQP
jgi:hypothetical protein